MEISSNVVNWTMLAKTEVIVQDIFLSWYLLVVFVFCSKPQLLAFISSLYKQVQLITYNEYQVQSFLSSGLIIYKFPLFALFSFFFSFGSSAWDTSFSNNYFTCLLHETVVSVLVQNTKGSCIWKGVKGLVIGYRLLDLYVSGSETVRGTRCRSVCCLKLAQQWVRWY